ncbi:nucleoside recognition protein [Methanoplanus endosymbiosus]|uniref:Nucleoside recognition protein n=1 Tax=Methanoplanus endosymbiosus TaxID=33865 RepID=A0A9E7PJW3_9EURY|nr:nucleoside recognition protein [Methanoplanus endosymbiosus]UUX91264.1 nucleoside recognition protein [Methanoplanus endosymbiosus]
MIALDFLKETLIQFLNLSLQTIPFMIPGVIFAEFLIAKKITGKIAKWTKPLTGFANLNDICGTSFLLAFISPKAANTMLVNYKDKELISEKEMIVASVMNSFPTVVMHWRYLLPVYIPLLGFTGILYFLILMAVGFGKTGVVMLYGRFKFREREYIPEEERGSVEFITSKAALKTAIESSKKPLIKILSITIPTLLIVSVLINLGIFDQLGNGMKNLSFLFPIPTAALAIIAAQFGSFIAGAGVASALLNGGELTPAEIITTLLIGNILTSVTRSIKWYGSSYAAIFGPKTGASVMIISTALRNGMMLIAVIILLTLF